jgi:hypothetical protein
MAAYPFQPMSMKKLKRLSASIKEPKHNANTNRLHKDFILSKTTRSASDETCNHPQIKIRKDQRS